MDWFRCFQDKYRLDTRGLSLAEHGAYLLMLFQIYSSERPIKTQEDAYLFCSAMTQDERFAVDRVLERFFKKTKSGYMNRRAQKEISYVSAKKILARKAGKISGSKRRSYSQRVAAIEAKGSATIVRAERMEAAQSAGTHTPAEWGLLFGFCGGKCLKCGTTEGVGKDHIEPVALGGSDAIGNIQPLCPPCNSAKMLQVIDYRPNGWKEFIEQTLNIRSADANSRSTNKTLDSDFRLQTKEKPKTIHTPAKPGFRPPSQEEVCGYMKLRNIPNAELQAERFIAHHSNRKWRLSGGRGPVMQDWRQAVVTWEGNIGKFEGGGNGNGQGNSRTRNAVDPMRSETARATGTVL